MRKTQTQPINRHRLKYSNVHRSHDQPMNDGAYFNISRWITFDVRLPVHQVSWHANFLCKFPDLNKAQTCNVGAMFFSKKSTNDCPIESIDHRVIIDFFRTRKKKREGTLDAEAAAAAGKLSICLPCLCVTVCIWNIDQSPSIFFFLHIHHHPVDMISTTHSRRVQRPAKLQLAAILEKELSQTRRNLPWLSICYQNGWMAPHLSCTHLFHKWPPSRSQGRRVINDSRLVPHLPARTTHAARTKIHWITDADVWIYSRWSRTLCL